MDKAARLKAAKKLGPGDQVCFDEPANVVVKVKSISEEGTDVLIRFEPVVKLNARSSKLTLKASTYGHREPTSTFRRWRLKKQQKQHKQQKKQQKQQKKQKQQKQQKKRQ